MLKDGEGIQINKKEAIQYLQKAIKKGHPNSMILFSKMLENGEGIEMNKEEAEKYRKMAAKSKK